jgi:hypothetical protein
MIGLEVNLLRRLFTISICHKVEPPLLRELIAALSAR